MFFEMQYGYKLTLISMEHREKPFDETCKKTSRDSICRIHEVYDMNGKRCLSKSYSETERDFLVVLLKRISVIAHKIK